MNMISGVNIFEKAEEAAQKTILDFIKECRFVQVGDVRIKSRYKTTPPYRKWKQDVYGFMYDLSMCNEGCSLGCETKDGYVYIKKMTLDWDWTLRVFVTVSPVIAGKYSVYFFRFDIYNLDIMKQKIILASASPRRKELLWQIGLDFTIAPSDFREDMSMPLGHAELAKTLAIGKSKSAAIGLPLYKLYLTMQKAGIDVFNLDK